MRVPRQQLVGQLNGGWRIAMTTLTHERGSASFGTQVQLKRALDTIIDAAKRCNVMASRSVPIQSSDKNWRKLHPGGCHAPQ